MVAGKYELEDGRWVGRTSVIVPLLDDDVREGTESFELNLRRPAHRSGKARLQNPGGSGCGDRCRHLIHIGDAEDSPALDLSVSPNEIMEQGETSATATVSITDSKSFAADQLHGHERRSGLGAIGWLPALAHRGSAPAGPRGCRVGRRRRGDVQPESGGYAQRGAGSGAAPGGVAPQDAAVVMVARTESGAPGGTPLTFSVSSRSGTAASSRDFRPVSEVLTLREQGYALEERRLGGATSSAADAARRRGM
ncbi:hypothetical protein [Candidatus Palauibacter sp.]|uniref:hypothetical protein n=1 Tax=Candidatus Palauibacter sp. TaxID=3101350 RepID=UPI003AF2B76D